MPKRADIPSDSDDSDVLIMTTPPPRPPTRLPALEADDDDEDPLDAFSPPPQPQSAGPKAKALKGGRSKATAASASSTPRAGGSSSKAPAASPAVRRLPPPQPARRQPAGKLGSSSSSTAAAGRNVNVQAVSEGEDEFSPGQPSSSSKAGRAGSRAARPSSRASSSSKKPSSTASASTPSSTGRKGKTPASSKTQASAGSSSRASAPANKPPPPPPAAPKPKARPGWKGYAEPGSYVTPPVPTKGYLSGLDMLWQQGMLDPFQDGEPLKKSLRSGRQVRGPAARWGDDGPDEEAEENREETAQQEQEQEQQSKAAVQGPSGDDSVDAEVAQQAQQAATGLVNDGEQAMDVDGDDYTGTGLSYEPGDQPDIASSPPLAALLSTPVASAAPTEAPPPPPASVSKPPVALPPSQNFRKISSAAAGPSQTAGSSTSTATAAAFSVIGRPPARPPTHEPSPFQVGPSRPLSPPLLNGFKRPLALDGEIPLPLKKLRSMLPPPPGASPRPSRTASNPPSTATVAGDAEGPPAPLEQADEDVTDLSFYPQIQVDFDADTAESTAAASAGSMFRHGPLSDADLVHLASTKSLVLSHLSGHAPLLSPPLPARAASTVATFDENAESVRTLTDLLRGTAEKGEGNSCLIQGVRGSGKTTVLHRALANVETSELDGYEPPHVIRLSALVQKDDKAAIKEIGRQFGLQDQDEPGETGESAEGEAATLAPTTLPAHLLALLTAPSRKAIVIILEEFDVFASFGRGGRQMLLYCLLDVVQSIRPSSEGLSGRGVAVVGVTSRLDTLHLLEKRVKSRFSHRIIRVVSPFHGDRSNLVSSGSGGARDATARPTTTDSGALVGHDGSGPPDGVMAEDEHDEPPRWTELLSQALVPWQLWEEAGPNGEGDWRGAWRESVEHLLSNPTIQTGLERLTWLTTDVRALLKIFILPIIRLTPEQPFLTPAAIQLSLTEQAQGAGWGKDMRKFKTLSLPCLSVLAAVKDLGERGIQEFNFEHVFFTYSEFAKARLVGTGKARFGRLVMKDAFNQLAQTAVLFPCASGTSASAQSFSTSAADYAKHRCAVSPYDIVELFRGPAGKGILSQLSAWGRKFDI